jgi:hypothetical protein
MRDAKRRSKQQRSYNSKPQQKRNRASRNAARKLLEGSGAVSKGDGKDVDHRDGNPKNNSRSNLRVRSRAANRSVY